MIRLIGAVLLLIGALSALFGPVETHVFHMFREGGRFHYEGFGFGSLMAVTILFTSKNISTTSLPVMTLCFLLLYPVLPIALLRFYRSRAVGSVLRAADAPSGWLSDTPQSVRVAGSLLALLVLVLHFPLLFGGLFPVFGQVATGLRGILFIDISIAATAVLAWGVAWRCRWAWLCAIVFLVLLIVSSTVTFLTTTPDEIVALMPFAPLEAEKVSGIPMRGYHLALFAGMIPLATFIAVAVSWRDFTGGCSRAAKNV